MTVLQVGAGAQYGTISAAIAASNDGDVVQVQAGTYTNDFAEVGKKITIEGVGGIAKLVATGPIPNGKAILITDTDVTIKNLEFTGATVNDGNGAGIRYQGGNLTIINSYFHDNENGLLAADNPSGSITIQNSEFSHNGTGDGRTHNLYVGDILSLTIDGSYFHDAVVGHEIKSRAENTTITNSRIIDGPNGTASYSIDLPNGGNAVISNNVIEKGPNSQNPFIISYGEEGGLHANSALQVTNNTIVDDQPSSPSTAAVSNSTGISAVVSGNRTFGLIPTQILRGSGTVSGTTLLSTAPTLDTASIQTGSNSGATPTPDPTPTPTPDPTPAPTPDPTPAPTGTSGLVLNISEDAWQGDAQYTISVDGQQVGGVRTATASHSAGQTEAVPVGVSLTQGTHAVGVTFLNDAYGGTASTDRNLYIDGATLDGQAVPGSAATLLSAGTDGFSVLAPASTSATGSDPNPGTSSGNTSTPPSGTSSDTPTNTTGLVLDISEDAWQGDAQYTISVDGQQVGGVRTASASHSAGQTEAVPISVSLTQGTHAVGVTFLNDAYGGTASTDRNLYIDGATLDGQPVPGSAATLLSAGTTNVNVQVPSSSQPDTSTQPATGTPVTSTPVTSTLTLNVAEDAWQGDAQMAVSVDGAASQIYTVTASRADGQEQTISIGGIAESFTPHDIAVSFLNDAYGGTATTDRNLYLNSMQLDGQSVPGASATFLSNGTQHFAASAPANWVG